MAAQQQASALQVERTNELATQLAAQQKSTFDAVELARSLQVGESERERERERELLGAG
jgi:hypothetical protein